MKIFPSTYYLLFILVILSISSCKKEQTPTKTIYMPQIMKDYFVNYSPGTCWVFKDSVGRNGQDTVELTFVQKAYFDNGGGTEYEGYIMNYTSNRSINFWIYAVANDNYSGTATLYPAITGPGEGALEAIYAGTAWMRGVLYDSLPIESGKIYHNVLKMGEGCFLFNNMRIAKDSGIVAFNAMSPIPSQEGAFYLVGRFKK